MVNPVVLELLQPIRTNYHPLDLHCSCWEDLERFLPILFEFLLLIFTSLHCSSFSGSPKLLTFEKTKNDLPRYRFLVLGNFKQIQGIWYLFIDNMFNCK